MRKGLHNYTLAPHQLTDMHKAGMLITLVSKEECIEIQRKFQQSYPIVSNFFKMMGDEK